MIDSPAHERGATALMVAGAMLFIFGAAALAVDTSIFYSDARTDQTTADLSCLAGVIEADDNAKITMAADFTRQNWPAMQDATVSTSGSSGTMTAAGNQVEIETNYDGDEDKMRVRVLETADTNFARALGAGSVTVVQEAICQTSLTGPGGGVLPFGAVTGGWTGPLQINPPCGPSNGNCGALSVPRDDVSGTGPTLIKNIAEGSDRMLDSWLGNRSGSVNCSAVNAGDTCHVIATDTGVSASHLGEGFIGRLGNDPGATCTWNHKGTAMNCDRPDHILGGDLADPTDDWTPIWNHTFDADQLVGGIPWFWDSDLYGAYNASNTAEHYWYDGVVTKCDSPRFAGVPIISENLDWDLGDSHEDWPNGAKPVKIVGFLDVIVTEPYENDIQGDKNLQTAGASVIWFGPNATCGENGPKVGMLNGAPVGTGGLSVKLISG